MHLALTIKLALDYILSNNPEVSISRKDLKKLFPFAASEMQFYFNREIYEQVDGVVMGSPLVPVLANLFMGHHEQHWSIQKEALSVFFIRDMLMLFFVFQNIRAGR